MVGVVWLLRRWLTQILPRRQLSHRVLITHWISNYSANLEPKIGVRIRKLTKLASSTSTDFYKFLFRHQPNHSKQTHHTNIEFEWHGILAIKTFCTGGKCPLICPLHQLVVLVLEKRSLHGSLPFSQWSFDKSLPKDSRRLSSGWLYLLSGTPLSFGESGFINSIPLGRAGSPPGNQRTSRWH